MQGSIYHMTLSVPTVFLLPMANTIASVNPCKPSVLFVVGQRGTAQARSDAAKRDV